MTTPNRWFQLSMLQILVATAVVAALSWLNITTTNSGMIAGAQGRLSVVEVRSGWPYRFRIAKAVVTETRIKEVGPPEYRWLSLSGNVVVGLILTAVCVSAFRGHSRR